MGTSGLIFWCPRHPAHERSLKLLARARLGQIVVHTSCIGIGLALVRQLVGDHRGTVQAQSDGEGRGSTFVVRIPAIEAEALAPSPGDISVRQTGDGCRVLIVDDQEDVRETSALLLRGEGHDVSAAATGEEALQAILADHFDVALVDIGLPGLDGYEVARRIRGGGDASAIRLIALTGYGQPNDVEAAAEAGFDLHMVKPVDPDRLVAHLSELAGANKQAP